MSTHSLLDEINRELANITMTQGEEHMDEPMETFHIYVVREPADAEEAPEQVIESSLVEDDPLPNHEAPSPDLQGPPQRRRALFLLVLFALCLILASDLAVFYVLSLLVPSATVVIVPVTREITTTTTIMVVPGTPGAGHLQGRLLPSLTLTQSQTVAATGQAHQDAQQAVGIITFFNGLFISQTVAAGTILTGADGVQVVTNQMAVIPAAIPKTPPIYGQMTVPAHSLIVGQRGNIAIRDINQACCLPSILAQNTTAFQGGENARTYTVVKKEDINHSATALTMTLSHSAEAALQVQLSPSESLLTPSCTPTITANHQAREEATRVMVTVSEQCIGIAYDRAALQARAISALTAEASTHLGTHYTRVGDIQVSILRTTISAKFNEIAQVSIRVTGTWMYRLSLEETQHITAMIAGKNKIQANILLRRIPGIQTVFVTLKNTNTIPADPKNIHLVFIKSI